MARNLVKRANKYYVRVAVPRRLWDALGKREVVRRTGTADLRQAERLKHSIIASIHAEIDEQAKDEHDPSSPAYVSVQARAIRKLLQRGELDHETAAVFVDVIREKHLKAIGQTDDESVPEPIARYIGSAYRAVTDASYVSLSDAVTDYLSHVESRVVNSTHKSKQKHLDTFAAWCPVQGLDEVTRGTAGEYVKVLAANGRSPTTNRNIVGILVSFFNWCRDEEKYKQDNPFAGKAKAFNGSKRGGNDPSYRAWTDAELTTMFAALDKTRPGTTLHRAREVARISLYSGMRLDEVCALKVADVKLDDGFMVISEGKNENSVRQVPIHRALKGTLKALIGRRTIGWLIDGLKPGGEDNKRSHSLGNRFSELKCELFPEAGRQLAFHGLRSTFITALEQAEVPTSTTELIVGHARQSMSYGLYSKGPGLDVLARAVGKASFVV